MIFSVKSIFVYVLYPQASLTFILALSINQDNLLYGKMTDASFCSSSMNSISIDVILSRRLEQCNLSSLRLP